MKTQQKLNTQRTVLNRFKVVRTCTRNSKTFERTSMKRFPVNETKTK